MVLVCDPERVRARAHDLVATSQEFLQASWAAAAGGGQAPIDLGAAAYRTLGDVRTHALDTRRWRGGRCRRSVSTPTAPTSIRRTTPAAHRDRRDRPDRRRHVQHRRDAERSTSGPPTPTAVTPSAAVNDIAELVKDGRTPSSWSPRATAPASGWSRCSATTTSPARLVEELATDDFGGPTGVVAGRAGQPRPRVRGRGDQASSCSPATTSPSQRTTAKDSQRMPSRRRKQIDPLELRDRRLRRPRAARRRPLRRDDPARRRRARPASTS